MIGQIHNMFPELSIVWLLFGEGEMDMLTKPDQAAENGSREDEMLDDGLFSYEQGGSGESKKIVFSSAEQGRAEFSKENGLRMGQNISQIPDPKVEMLQKRIKDLQTQIENFKKNPRKAVQITVYYDDNTFETFFPR